jgi:hypothetical protein
MAENLQASTPGYDLQAGQDQDHATESRPDTAVRKHEQQALMTEGLPRGIYESCGEPADLPLRIVYMYTAHRKTRHQQPAPDFVNISHYDTYRFETLGVYASKEDAENRIRAVTHSVDFMEEDDDASDGIFLHGLATKD